MARTILFDFAQGGGSTLTEGRLTLAGTQMHTSGSTVILPATYVTFVEGGIASIPDVEPTPPEVDGWRYQVKLETLDGTVHRWIVSVPDDTSNIDFADLPVQEATSVPIDATGVQLEAWFTSTRAQAQAANQNAINALDLINQHHGSNAAPPVYRSADTWEDLKIIVLANGTIKGIPVGDMPPAQPVIGAVTPGSIAVKVIWAYLSGATSYKLFRNGIELYSGNSDRYTDRNVTAGTTYTYTVIAYDRHGQRSAISASVTGSPDTALNVPPTIGITTWPSPLPQSGSGIIRVVASDVEAQHLVLTLSVTTGSITPTRDPSIWVFTS